MSRLGLQQIRCTVGTAVIGPVDLEVPRGEVVGLTGPSGAGKTTIAAVAAGLRAPSDGIRNLDGQQTSRWGWDAPPEQRRRVQLVPQHPHRAVDPRHTLAEALLRPARLHDIPDQTALDWATSCHVGDDLLGRRPGQVSGGQLQRLVLARALALSPDYLLLDEATTGQDTITTAILVQVIAEQAARGAGVLLITHDQQILTHLVTTTTLRMPSPAPGRVEDPAAHSSARRVR